MIRKEICFGVAAAGLMAMLYSCSNSPAQRVSNKQVNQPGAPAKLVVNNTTEEPNPTATVPPQANIRVAVSQHAETLKTNKDQIVSAVRSLLKDSTISGMTASLTTAGNIGKAYKSDVSDLTSNSPVWVVDVKGNLADPIQVLGANGHLETATGSEMNVILSAQDGHVKSFGLAINKAL